MLNNSSKIMFMLILMMSTIIVISSNSWLSAWMGLEINLLSFIPLMSDNKLMSTESSLKYFLTQALASSLLLFSMIMNFINFNMMNMEMIINMFMYSSLLLKMGVAPFHMWFPNIMEGLSWFNVLLLMTWQKIAPLMLISYMTINFMMITSIILSSIIGSLGGLNQTSVRKLMAYSSINHLSWMLSAMFNNNLLWIIYFLFYSLISFTMILMFNMFEISHINQLFSLMFNSKILKFILFCNLLSMGGLPPFMGFFPKWIVIQMLTMNNQMFLMFIITLMSLITLFFYLRLTYSAFMLNYFENNWLMTCNYKNMKMIIFMFLSMISILSLFFITFLYF